MILTHQKNSFDMAMRAGMACMIFRIPGRPVELSTDYAPEELILTSWRKTHLSFKSSGSKIVANLPEETSYDQYRQGFIAYQRAFDDSNLKKAVLSAIVRTKTPVDFEPLEFFLRLCTDQPKAFVYLLFHPEAGLWCGATPEILISGDHTSYQTMSLAGTQPLSAKGAYTWTEKEVEEQELVSQHIREVLHSINASNVEESATETIEAGQVAHLKTSFVFNYVETVNHLLSKIHPTPAIAGLPVKESLELIERIETHDRGLYTGYLGINTPKETRIYVNLRCMQIGIDDIALYVGGGITSKSDLNDEWEETRLKAKTLLNLLKSTD